MEHSCGRRWRKGIGRALVAAMLISAGAGTARCAQPARSQEVVRVATPANLPALIAGAEAGQTILLGDGDYGQLLIRKRFGGAGLVIRTKPGAKATFSKIVVGNAEGVQLTGLEVAIDAPRYGVFVGNSSRITLSGLRIYAAPGATQSAIGVRASSDITVADCEIRDVGFGIGLLDSERLKILRNTFTGLQVDAIRGAASQVEVIGNRATNFHPKPGDHPDFIQIWGKKSGPSRSIIIKENVFERGDGAVVQGIFLEDNEDVVISGNALLGTMYNGIGLARVRRVVVEDNFVQGYKDMGTRIITRGKSSDVTVRNNVAERIVTVNDGGLPNPGYKEERNKSVRPAAIGDVSAMQTWLKSRPPL